MGRVVDGPRRLPQQTQHTANDCPGGLNINSLALVASYVWLNLRASSQYRLNFAIGTAGLELSSLLSGVVAIVIVGRFGNVNGWETGQIIFLYSLWRAQHGLLYLVATPAQHVDSLILNGQIDRMLVRPTHVLLQLAG